MSLKDLEDYYRGFNNKNIFRDKCYENKCGLKDVSKKEYLTINGDEIEKIKNDGQQGNSSDCIIIQKNPIKQQYKIILCELTRGVKEIDVLRRKFKNSGEEICNTFKELGLEIHSLKCVFLGDIKNMHRVKKELNKPIIISNLIINKKPARNIIIRRYKCDENVSIKQF